MTESQLYDTLKSYGFLITPYCSFGLTETPSIDFFPVALKIESEKVIHKSDFGAVKLNINSMQALEKAKEEIIANISAKEVVLDATDRFIATQMVSGIELYVGLVDDDIFGKTVVFGMGGVFLELYKDVCYIDLYADNAEIRHAIGLTKISKVFEGFRGFDFSIEMAVEFIRSFQNFAKANPDIIELDFNPVILTKAGLKIADARIKKGEQKPEKLGTLRTNRPPFFSNQRVVLIGVSSDTTKVGYSIAKNSLRYGGELFFVNAKGGELFGKQLYTNIAHIEGNIDTAVIMIPSKRVTESIKELIERNLQNLIIISAGFKEAGDNEAERIILSLSQQHNFNVIGPNCLGYLNSTENLNLTFGIGGLKNGKLALLSQSGAVLSALMDKAYDAGIGFSHLVSCGNMVDLDFAEMIDMLNHEEMCEYISIYAEGIQNGKEFLRAIRESKKKIYIFKTGKSIESKKAAFSHTGNLSGNYAMFKGLIESVGAKIEKNIEALLFNPSNEVNSILIVTNAGGPATILTDYLIDQDKTLYTLSEDELQALNKVLPPHWSKNNPVDIIGDAMANRYEKTLEVVTKFKGVDLIYLLITPQCMTDSLAIVQLCEREWGKKIYPILLGGHEMEEAKEYLRIRQKLFFKTLQSATSFL
ncbi:MAG: acetate--CoA ligase family protein [Sulfuricurvum sp.]|nr:acetate--CoA ligase family protein [Sulfuricurvum sp.]MDD5386521.1 acetate--CoA ligase family protein [Sulfuricurvum sp.]